MWHELRLFFVALQFLTRLPVPGWVGFEPAWLNHSARWFPAVGSLVGAVAALVLLGAANLWSWPVAVVLSMAATVLLTGAFHEDGLADTCDALGGSVSRERALEIMKDSRIGSYGAVALVLVLGLKAATLAALQPAVAAAALVVGHTLSRAAAVVLVRWLPYAGYPERAKAKPLAQSISGAGLAVALLSACAVVAVVVAWRPGLAPLAATGLVSAAAGTVAAGAWLRRRLGGFTGDGLGATQQITEVLVLLGWLGAARWLA